MEFGRAARSFTILMCLLTLQGCAAAALSVVGIAEGAGFEHVMNGMVNHTYSRPIAGTRLATLGTLKRMGMSVTKDKRTDDGWEIMAKAAERTIDIELEPLSERSVQMSVDVHREDFILLKDPSTARQIIEQTGIELRRLSAKRSRIASVQMMLSELGYDTTNPDGILGPKTKRAILRFQRKNAIRVDGQVGPRLLAKVQRKRNALKSRKKKTRSSGIRRKTGTQSLNSEQEFGD